MDWTPLAVSIVGAAGWGFYVVARWDRPTLVAAARDLGQKEGQKEVTAIRRQLEEEKTAAATALDTAKDNYDIAIGVVCDECLFQRKLPTVPRQSYHSFQVKLPAVGA